MNRLELEVAEQLVRHPNWRWLPGMRAGVFIERSEVWHWSRITREDEHGPTKVYAATSRWVPDLQDPLTAASLITMLGAPKHLPQSWMSKWHARPDELGLILGQEVLGQWSLQ